MEGSFVNDVHSQLNGTRVRRIVQVSSVGELRGVMRLASDQGDVICISGGRHAMGGQQFATDGVLVDMRAINQVVAFDPKSGLIEAEAGIQWPELIARYLALQEETTRQWGIAQKQTGADRLTIGGTLASNSHGRGLLMKPFIADVESFRMMRADGELVTCSRRENDELFRLAIGGYGLFGIAVSVTLRLAPRVRLRRLVEIIGIDGLLDACQQRIARGALYGDFQFAIAGESPDFLYRGVLSTYELVDSEAVESVTPNELSQEDWNNLAYLAHTDKERAFQVYSDHYLSTSGQNYWSDTHQLSPYLDRYHELLDQKIGGTPGTEVITELYMPRHSLTSFMGLVRDDFRQNQVDLIYGTIRLIERDDESFLAWAKDAYACVVFNLHTEHTLEGIRHSANAVRRLIDLAVTYGGSYSLTYNKFATNPQVEACYPQFREFLRLKKAYDPHELFQSDWYRHYRKLFSE